MAHQIVINGETYTLKRVDETTFKKDVADTDLMFYASPVGKFYHTTFLDVKESISAADGTNFLAINSMDALRSLTGSNLSAITNGRYDYVELLGYYDGITYDKSINYYWDPLSILPDNGGSVIKVNGIDTGRFIHRFEEEVSVEYFGATGDGITDDSEFIENALSYDNVFIPATDDGYLITRPISPSSPNVSITSNGAVIKPNGKFDLISIASALSVSVQGVTFNHIDLEYVTDLFYGIRITGTQEVTLTNVNYVNCSPILDTCSNINIYGNAIDKAPYMGFFLVRCTDAKLYGNSCTKAISAYRTEDCHNIIITGNTSDDIFNEAVRIEDSKRVIIANNIISNCKSGVVIYGAGSGVSYGTEDIIIVDNDFYNCYKPLTSPPANTYVNNLSGFAISSKKKINGLTISGNQFRGDGVAVDIVDLSISNVVFNPGISWVESSITSDVTGKSQYVVTPYGEYVRILLPGGTLPADWLYYVNLPAPVDLSTSGYLTFDMYSSTSSLVTPEQFSVRLYSGVDKAGLIATLPFYNGGAVSIESIPISIRIPDDVDASSIQSIEIVSNIVTQGTLFLSGFRSGVDQRIGYLHSYLSKDESENTFIYNNQFIGVTYPYVDRRTTLSDLDKMTFIDDQAKIYTSSTRPFNIRNGFQIMESDTQRVLYYNNGSFVPPIPDSDLTLSKILDRGNTGFNSLNLDRNSPTNMGIFLRNNGLLRWGVYEDSSEEGVGNVGSNLIISRYDNSGAFIDIPFRINRDTGIIQANRIIATQLGGQNGSETVAGLLEIATQEETNAGTNDTRAVTPAKINRSGGSRPAGTLKTGLIFFDTNISKPIWWSGANWVDANGTIV